MTTGQLIKKYREKAGLTVTAASAKAGVGQRNWHDYEKDEMSPTVKMLERMAPALEVDARDLVPTDDLLTDV